MRRVAVHGAHPPAGPSGGGTEVTLQVSGRCGQVESMLQGASSKRRHVRTGGGPGSAHGLPVQQRDGGAQRARAPAERHGGHLQRAGLATAGQQQHQRCLFWTSSGSGSVFFRRRALSGDSPGCAGPRHAGGAARGGGRLRIQPQLRLLPAAAGARHAPRARTALRQLPHHAAPGGLPGPGRHGARPCCMFVAGAMGAKDTVARRCAAYRRGCCGRCCGWRARRRTAATWSCRPT